MSAHTPKPNPPITTQPIKPAPVAAPVPPPPPSPAKLPAPLPPPVPQPVPPPAPVVADTGDIASESVCPGQNDLAQAPTVLVCMSAYARLQHGISSISASSALMQSATAKTQDLVNCGFSHTACGHEFDYWIKAKGYTGSCSAENIAQGQATPKAVFVAWMNSPGHRANILTPSYRDMGVNVAISPAGQTWTMHLGGC